MPWIPMYAADADFELLRSWINTSTELAYIVRDGPKRWRAVATLEGLGTQRVCLWHVPSGPLPLLHAHPSERVDAIEDPWAGWQELCPEANGGHNPFFGAGHAGIFWLNHYPTPSKNPNILGMSSFEWIGNRYRIIGQPAEPSTEQCWKRLRTWIGKQSIKLPRSGPPGAGAEIFALPSARAKIEAGMGRDSNPSW